jgi:hypothetical protein
MGGAVRDGGGEERERVCVCERERCVREMRAGGGGGGGKEERDT